MDDPAPLLTLGDLPATVSSVPSKDVLVYVNLTTGESPKELLVKI